jgi:hypothetical protein
MAIGDLTAEQATRIALVVAKSALLEHDLAERIRQEVVALINEALKRIEEARNGN